MGGKQPKARALKTAGLGVVLVLGMVFGPSAAAGNTPPSVGAVDLSIEVVADPAVTGSVIQFESRVHNRGTRVAEHVTATYEIPVAAVAVGLDSQLCTASGSAQVEMGESPVDQPWVVTCDLGTVPPGSDKWIALSVTVGPHGTWTGAAKVSSDSADVRPFDNRIEVPLYVLPDQPAFTPAFQQPGGLNPLSRANA